MATSRTLLCYCVNIFFLYFIDLTVTQDEHWLKDVNSGKVHLKHLGEHGKSVPSLLNEDGYFADTRQEKPDPHVLGGVHIEHEAQKLSAQLRWLSNEEIGITNMQVCTVNFFF